MTTNISEETRSLFENLLSSDQMITDETYDYILFSDDPEMNRQIIDVMKVSKNNVGMLCECLQLLSFRCSQTNETRLYSRPQTTEEQQFILSEVLEHLGSLRAIVRLESLIALEEIFQYSEKSSKLIKSLQTYGLPYVLADEDLHQTVLERLEVCTHDPNSLVAQRAEECYKRIDANISSARGYLRSKNIEFKKPEKEVELKKNVQE